MSSPRDVIGETIRSEGWTCEYHEPVNGPGECSQCDDSHERLGDRILAALAAAGYEVVGPLPEPDELELGYWITNHDLVQISNDGKVCTDNWSVCQTPDEARHTASALLAAARRVEEERR